MSEEDLSPDAPHPPPADDGESDADGPSATLLAIRNAVKLGGSLVFTWGIALAIRLLLPRYLGPKRFGTLNFADAFTIAFFIVLNLGMDPYVRKEVAVRPSHASDFFGGTLVIRMGMTLGVFLGMGAVLHFAGRSSEVQGVVFLYGATQFFVTINATFSAMLHAKGRVGAMSALAVATKVVWAVGILTAMATGAGLWAYAASYLASEAIEAVVLYRLAQGHLGLRFEIDRVATKAMLVASLPYYVNLFATTAYGKLDVSMLEFVGSTEEVGWYGAAQAVASLTLLVTPLIGWVLTPMFARAAARSPAEFDEQVRRSMELILTVAIPASLMINVGADVWIGVIFGSSFAPAAGALRVLATMFVLTYVAIVYSLVLVMREKPWTLTIISALGLVVNVALNLFIIRFSIRTFGPGGGGLGCAVAALGTEVFVTVGMMATAGRGAFDGRSLMMIGKSLGACVLVVVVHRALAGIGPARLIVDGIVYLTVVLATGALRLGQMYGVARDALRSRRAA